MQHTDLLEFLAAIHLQLGGGLTFPGAQSPQGQEAQLFGFFLNYSFQFLKNQARLVQLPSPIREFGESETSFLSRLWDCKADEWLHERTYFLQILNMRFLAQDLHRFGGSQKVLSLGSGYGICELFLACRWFTSAGLASFSCVENSARMRELSELLHAHLREQGFQMADFTVQSGNICGLPLDDSSFDHVLMLSSLHGCGNWKLAVREAVRVLRPANPGKLHIVFPENVSCWGVPIVGVTDDTLRLEDLLDHLEACGLQIEVVASYLLPPQANSSSPVRCISAQKLQGANPVSWRVCMKELLNELQK